MRKLGAPKDLFKHVQVVELDQMTQLEAMRDDADKYSMHSKTDMLHPTHALKKKHNIYSLYAEAKHRADAMEEEKSKRMLKQRQAKSKYGNPHFMFRLLKECVNEKWWTWKKEQEKILKMNKKKY